MAHKQQNSRMVSGKSNQPYGVQCSGGLLTLVDSCRMTIADGNTATHLATVEYKEECAKTALARTLHDDLNGLLVAASMDVSTGMVRARQDLDLHARLARIRGYLSAAIDLNRGLIEELRPSLLDNFGLFSALQRHHRRCCGENHICSHSYPEVEPAFSSESSTTLFRIVQEALTSLKRHPLARRAQLHVGIDLNELTIQIEHDGDELLNARDASDELASQWLIGQRVRSLGGRLAVATPTDGGVQLNVAIPLGNLLPPGDL